VAAASAMAPPPEEESLERIEVTPASPPLPVLDAPDLISARPPEVPRALAQHDYRPPRQMRHRDRSGAIVAEQPRRRSGLATAPSADLEGGAPTAPAPRSIERATGAAADPLPLVQGSDDVPADLPPGPHTSVATLAAPVAAYLDEVRRAVRAQWRPSDILGRLDADGSRSQLTAGQTLLRVRIRADGTVERLSIDESSGLPALDGEATDAFGRAQPFSPPPALIADGGGGFDFRFALYLDLSLARFMRHTARLLRGTWSPPHLDRSGSFREVAVARVRLRGDGALAEVTIELSSGRPAVDESALAAIRGLERFPAPPPALGVGSGLSQFRIAFVARAYGGNELRLFRHPPDPQALLAGPRPRP
jgi:TonB family protein